MEHDLAPRGDFLKLAAEVQELRRVVLRLAGAVLWDRGSPASAEPLSRQSRVPVPPIKENTVERLSWSRPERTHSDVVQLIPQELAQNRDTS